MKAMTVALRDSQRHLLLLGGMLALLFAALPAQAQEVCADIDDVVEDVSDLYVDELFDEFDVDLDDPELCSKLTQNFIKGCQTAVKDAVKCVQNQIKTLDKQNQTLCKALAGSGASACASSYKNEAKASSNAIASEGAIRSEICAIEAASDFYEVCMFGF